MLELEAITVLGNDGKQRAIRLCLGDLTGIPPGEEVDVLVVSAFPGDYVPTAGSLIGALYQRRGLAVGELAGNKQIDLTNIYSSWLSHDIRPRHPQLGFARVLCFEPLRDRKGKSMAQRIGDMFRSLLPILYDDGQLRSIAMPLLTAGDQGNRPADVVPPLIEAAVHWLALGIPLDTIKIVEIDPNRAEEARRSFRSVAEQFRTLTSAATATKSYDVFISYAHEDEQAVADFAARLRRAEFHVFLDRLNLNPGSAWQAEIFAALDDSHKIISVYSPDYLASDICKEEFNVAYARNRKEKGVLLPVLLRGTKLPTFMSLLQYVDARDGTPPAVDAVWPRIISTLSHPARKAARP